MITTQSGLQYKEIREGTGPKAPTGFQVTRHTALQGHCLLLLRPQELRCHVGIMRCLDRISGSLLVCYLLCQPCMQASR